MFTVAPRGRENFAKLSGTPRLMAHAMVFGNATDELSTANAVAKDGTPAFMTCRKEGGGGCWEAFPAFLAPPRFLVEKNTLENRVDVATTYIPGSATAACAPSPSKMQNTYFPSADNICVGSHVPEMRPATIELTPMGINCVAHLTHNWIILSRA